jgi:hypothetical protein
VKQEESYHSYTRKMLLQGEVEQQRMFHWKGSWAKAKDELDDLEMKTLVAINIEKLTSIIVKRAM